MKITTKLRRPTIRPLVGLLEIKPPINPPTAIAAITDQIPISIAVRGFSNTAKTTRNIEDVPSSGNSDSV
jgi:hypothetical protein